MRLRHATSILVFLTLAVLAAGADDFWLKKDWKEWTPAECKKMLEDSPWTKKVLVENMPVRSRLPDAPNVTDGLNPGQAKYANDDDAGEIRYIIQLPSAAPIRQAQIRLHQIDDQ